MLAVDVAKSVAESERTNLINKTTKDYLRCEVVLDLSRVCFCRIDGVLSKFLKRFWQ